MIGLLQRVRSASVAIGGEEVAAIGVGLLVLVGVQRGDGERQAERLLERLLGYRGFADAAGRMNQSVRDTGGSLLLVPQFTLAADTRSGTRPGFSTAADPQTGHPVVACGRFGADMQVALVNDGPVTFWIEVAATA